MSAALFHPDPLGLPPGEELCRVYASHFGWLKLWFRKRSVLSQDAEDLAQEVFMRVVAGHQRYDLSSPRALLTTIAAGIVVDHYRRDSLERAFLDGLALLPESYVPSPESRSVVLETLHEVDRLLDSLRPIVRRAFLLSRLDGLSHQEISQSLNVSLSSVQKYLAQALLRCYQAAYEPISG